MNSITIPDTEQVEIRRDGAYVTTVSNGALLPWFHQEHSFSMDHALEFEGYTLVPVEERFVVYAENDGAPDTIIAIKATRLAAKRALTKFERSPEVIGHKRYGWRTEYSHNGTWIEA